MPILQTNFPEEFEYVRSAELSVTSAEKFLEQKYKNKKKKPSENKSEDASNGISAETLSCIFTGPSLFFVGTASTNGTFRFKILGRAYSANEFPQEFEYVRFAELSVTSAEKFLEQKDKNKKQKANGRREFSISFPYLS
ncbi:hypothetical protein CEXT_759731 [Caerostris extrusa]|uniref:Uncharacterized protein n=1 Tax=Caerostris extrusa TaxID=172846 RepID=A0AAV4N0M2_CAEEX|nr:hypothetical protein CEXT_759731 [Caerostris extrusa]